MTMKILMTSSGGIIRGIENWPEYGLARQLVKLGHDVTVISSSFAMKKHDAMPRETIDGIAVRRFNPVLPGSFMYMLKGGFDLVHMHHLGYLAPISSYAALKNKLSGIPSVFTVHGIYHDPYLVRDVEDPFASRVKKSLLLSFPWIKPWRALEWVSHLPLQASRITAMTKWEKKEITKLGIDSKKVDVIPNGIDIGKYGKSAKNFYKKRGIGGTVLLFVGQPSKRKGWTYFLRAMPEILKKYPDVRAVFIGYRENPELEAVARQLRIEKSVVTLGYLEESEKISALKSADVFVLPTLYEGFGIVFLEAMAAGIPIVTTDVAGNSEIVENMKNGILARPRDEKSIAASVIKLLENRRLVTGMAKNNLKKVRDYDWKKVSKKYLETYEQAVKR